MNVVGMYPGPRRCACSGDPRIEMTETVRYCSVDGVGVPWDGLTKASSAKNGEVRIVSVVVSLK